MPSDALNDDPRVPVSTTMRWQTLAMVLPIALVIDAAVVCLGWFIWAHQF